MDIVARHRPFSHALCSSVFSPEIEFQIFSMLENCTWEQRRSSFYNFYVPSSASVRSDIVALLGVTAINSLKATLEHVFMTDLNETISVEIHKYEIGCGIGPHTDALTQEVRLVLSYNRQWSPNSGNIWVLATDSALTESTAFLPSISNSGFALSTGRNSFHALSTVCMGVYFGVTLRFKRLGER